MTDQEMSHTVQEIEWSLAVAEPPLRDTDTLLFDYLPAVLGIRVPDWPMCRDHEPPATAFRRALSYDMDAVRAHYPKILVVANRTGGKSFFAALIEWLKAKRFPRFEGRILGGSADQALECYKHAVQFCQGLGNKLMSDLKAEPTRDRMGFRNGSLLQCLKASQTSVRGGHPNDLVIDETDEVPRPIFEAAQSMPHRRRTADIPKQLIMTSTINRAGGLVEGLIREAERRGIEVITYCWKEVTRTCNVPIECKDCPVWDYCRGDLKAARECIVLDVNELEEVRVAVPFRDGHHETVIDRTDIREEGPIQAGDRVHVAGNPHGFLEILDVLDVFDMVSEETWESEWCCLLRQPLGAVLKRTQIDGCCVEMNYSPDKPHALDRRIKHTWLGIDWGYRNETCAVVFQWDGANDLRIIAEAHWTEKTGRELADIIDAIGERYGTKEAYADSSDPDKIAELKTRGWLVHSVAFGTWKERCLEALRVWLQGRDDRSLSINRNLSHLISALIGWRYKDSVTNEDPEVAILKKDDHPCDATLAGMRRFARRTSPRARVGQEIDAPALKGTVEELLGQV